MIAVAAFGKIALFYWRPNSMCGQFVSLLYVFAAIVSQYETKVGNKFVSDLFRLFRFKEKRKLLAKNPKSKINLRHAACGMRLMPQILIMLNVIKWIDAKHKIWPIRWKSKLIRDIVYFFYTRCVKYNESAYVLYFCAMRFSIWNAQFSSLTYAEWNDFAAHAWTSHDMYTLLTLLPWTLNTEHWTWTWTKWMNQFTSFNCHHLTMSVKYFINSANI